MKKTLPLLLLAIAGQFNAAWAQDKKLITTISIFDDVCQIEGIKATTISPNPVPPSLDFTVSSLMAGLGVCGDFRYPFWENTRMSLSADVPIKLGFGSQQLTGPFGGGSQASKLPLFYSGGLMAAVNFGTGASYDIYDGIGFFLNAGPCLRGTTVNEFSYNINYYDPNTNTSTDYQFIYKLKPLFSLDFGGGIRWWTRKDKAVEIGVHVSKIPGTQLSYGGHFGWLIGY